MLAAALALAGVVGAGNAAIAAQPGVPSGLQQANTADPAAPRSMPLPPRRTWPISWSSAPPRPRWPWTARPR
ncbi:hypothetical protein AB5I41_18210 [Sphingomonas sp. MMS24-JH45]